MSDAYAFWRDQLAGRNPELRGEGCPEAGFYEGVWRKSIPNPSPTVGGPRRKIVKVPQVYAIWNDGGHWLCRIDSGEGVRLEDRADVIDSIFAVACRKAISFETYQERVNEYERNRSHATGAAPVGADRHGDEVWDGAVCV